MWKPYIVLQIKDQFKQKKKAKRIERELTKHARAVEKQRKRESKEKRAQARMDANTPEIRAAQEEAKRLYKAKWTTSACEEQIGGLSKSAARHQTSIAGEFSSNLSMCSMMKGQGLSWRGLEKLHNMAFFGFFFAASAIFMAAWRKATT